ncbi:formimidoylglutamate deiminase [Sphingomonas sp. HF-S3]|uniref:Formimidoylglutamate deiminase n=1 Tax=Sphingomonas rustica TaxID=3103142 RepID=A0ABV0B4B6_9SPHN
MTLWFETAWIDGCWTDRVRLRFADGRIASVEHCVDPAASDERHAIGVPGLPNVHSHAFQRGMAGLAERRGPGDDDFWSWRELMYRFVERITPDDLEAIAAQAYAEMLESGFTRVGEFHYLHHLPDGTAGPQMAAAIVAAARATGIGLTLLPVFYAQGGFGGIPAGPAQRRFITGVDGYARLIEQSRDLASVLPGARVGIAPHSLRATTLDQLRAILPLAQDGPVHIHVAEQVKEVEDCLAWSGQRPVEWLLDKMPVDPDWTLVHATHLVEAERRAMAASGAVAGLCPITEANLGDGLFPAPAYLADGGAIAVGSDSNVRIDAAEELRLLEYGQRLSARARNVLAGEHRSATGARLFDAAVRGGRRSLGIADDRADFVALDPSDPAFVGRRGDALIDSWIFAARAPVDCVWQQGVKCVADGRHVARDAIERRFRAALTRLIA